MGVTARDLFFVLRVRDEASGALNAVSRDLIRVGAAAQTEAKRAEAAALRQRAANMRAALATRQQTEAIAARMEQDRIQQARSALAARQQAEAVAARLEQDRIRQLRASGATQQQIAQALQNARNLRTAQMQASAATRQQIDGMVQNANRMRTASMQQTIVQRQQIKSTEDAATAIDREAVAMEKAEAKAGRLRAAMTSAGKAMAVIGTGLVAAGALGVAALLSTTNDAIEYQRQVALTKTQVDGFSASLKQLSQIGIDTANNIAVPFQEIQPALYDIFSSTDANLSQATTLLQAFAKAAVAGQVSIEDSSRSTMGIMNAFKIPFENVNKVLDVQFQLVRKGVGTYGQFSSVIGRAVPSAVRYGQSLETLAGSLAFLTRNGLSPAMAAASVARAMDALDNPTAVANMKKLGIAVYDSAGNFRPMTDVLFDLRKKLMAMPKADRVKAIFETFKGAGGTIQARRFLDQVLLKPGQLEALVGFINDMTGATGQFGSAYNQMSTTASAQTQLLKNKWSTLKVTVGEVLTPALIVLVTWLNKVFTWFEKLSPKTQKLIIWGFLAASVILILAGLFLIFAGAIATVAGILGGLDPIVLGVIGVLSLLVGAIAGGVKHFKELYANSKPFRDWVARMKQHILDLRDTFVKGWDSIKKTWDTKVKPALDAFVKMWQTKVEPVIEHFTEVTMIIFNKRVKEAVGWITKFINDGLVLLSWVIKNIVDPIIADMAKYLKKHGKEVTEILTLLSYVALGLAIIFGGILFLAIMSIAGVLVSLAAIAWVVIHVFTFLFQILMITSKWLVNTFIWLEKAGISVLKFLRLVGQLPGEIKKAILHGFEKAETWLINAGERIMKGLAKGIANGIPGLGGLLGQITGYIITHKGPKEKDLKMLEPAGIHIMTGLVTGIQSKMSLLDRTVRSVNQSITPKRETGTATLVQPVRVQRPVPQPPTKHVEQKITIYTNEIDPRKHAADLGWELSNRM